MLAFYDAAARTMGKARAALKQLATTNPSFASCLDGSGKALDCLGEVARELRGVGV